MESHQPITNASAVILTGGKSSRMGRPKALLPFNGEPLIVYIVRALQHLFSDIVVVAAPEQELPQLPATLVRDEVPFQGPVGGIYYGLKAAGGEYCFVTSCDVAFLNFSLISNLLSQISDYDVVVPYWENRFQPLHAVYRRSVLPLLKEQLERGELRPIFLYDKVRTCKVGEEEIRRFDPEGLSFLNMNTPEDYQSALKRWREARHRDETEDAVRPVPEPVTVELFGVARLLTKTRSVSLSLPGEASLADVLAALAARLPVLVGRVINADGAALVSGYACNINGLNFIRNASAKVNSGDKIFILSADAGG
ncbi:MAG TPA: molybdenum cofactor guanylyltransferase [Candidatus Binatia bacterium]|nr:molybdenum cofactor guanylyltransferase [Candidatus Binatia bacterium]